MDNVFAAAAIPHLCVPLSPPEDLHPFAWPLEREVWQGAPPPPSLGQLGSEAADLHDGLGSEAVEGGSLVKSSEILAAANILLTPIF